MHTFHEGTRAHLSTCKDHTFRENSNHTNFLIPTHLGKSLCKCGVLGGQCYKIDRCKLFPRYFIGSSTVFMMNIWKQDWRLQGNKVFNKLSNVNWKSLSGQSATCSLYPICCTVDSFIHTSYNYTNMKPTRQTLTEYSCTELDQWWEWGYFYCTATLRCAIQILSCHNTDDLQYLHPINPTLWFSLSFCLSITITTEFCYRDLVSKNIAWHPCDMMTQLLSFLVPLWGAWINHKHMQQLPCSDAH